MLTIRSVAVLILLLTLGAPLAHADVTDEPFVGFDYRTVRADPANHLQDDMQPYVEVTRVHPGKQAQSIGLKTGDKIINVTAPSIPPLDANEQPVHPRYWKHPYPAAHAVVTYIELAHTNAAPSFSLIIQRADPNGLTPTRKELQFKFPNTAARMCDFTIMEIPDSCGWYRAWKRAQADPPTANKEDTERKRQPLPPARQDRPYTPAPTLEQQQAQCDQLNETACLHLDRYKKLAAACTTDFDARSCTDALEYPFADRQALGSANVQLWGFNGYVETCLQGQRAACEKAVASPIASSPGAARRIDEVRRKLAALNIPPNPNVAREPVPSKRVQTTTQPATTMFPTSFYVMLGFAAAMLLTAALAAIAIPRTTGTTEASGPSVLEQLRASLVANPTLVLKVLGSLIIIALAIWSIITFTLLTVIFLAIAGGIAIYVYVSNKSAGK